MNYEQAHTKWLNARRDHERVPTDYMYFRMCMAYCDCIDADMPALSARVRAALIQEHPNEAREFGELDGGVGGDTNK